MEKEISIAQFIRVIERLPEDESKVDPRKWYVTQKEHWLGWLDEYHGPGAYGRKSGKKRDAKYTYNHIVEPEMLLYLIRAIPLRPELVEGAEKAAPAGKTLMAKSDAIRKVVVWAEIHQALWGDDDLTSTSDEGLTGIMAGSLSGLRSIFQRRRENLKMEGYSDRIVIPDIPEGPGVCLIESETGELLQIAASNNIRRRIGELLDSQGTICVHGPKIYAAQRDGDRIYIRWKLTPQYTEEKKRLMQSKVIQWR